MCKELFWLPRKYYRHKVVDALNGFSCHTRVFSGTDALGYLETLPYHRALVVTDAFFAENGTAEAVGGRIPDAEARVYGDVRPDPDVETVARGVAAMEAFSPDVLIALGGGSPMDCAKAMRYASGREIPLIAVPTTSGTGSEVTTFAIITSGRTKLALVDDALAPDAAVLDEALVRSLPPALVADAGFDLLSHCAEAAAATGASKASTALACGAFSTAYRLLERSFRGETSVRGQIHEASCLAGIAFNSAGLGACHALSHALGGRFHVAHGRLNAVLLPAVMARCAPACAGAYSDLARAAGVAGSTDTLRLRNLLSGLRRLRAQLCLPETLAQAGIDPAALDGAMDDLCRAALDDRCIRTSPVRFSLDDLAAIVREVSA